MIEGKRGFDCVFCDATAASKVKVSSVHYVGVCDHAECLYWSRELAVSSAARAVVLDYALRGADLGLRGAL